MSTTTTSMCDFRGCQDLFVPKSRVLRMLSLNRSKSCSLPVPALPPLDRLICFLFQQNAAKLISLQHLDQRRATLGLGTNQIIRLDHVLLILKRAINHETNKADLGAIMMKRESTPEQEILHDYLMAKRHGDERRASGAYCSVNHEYYAQVI